MSHHPAAASAASQARRLEPPRRPPSASAAAVQRGRSTARRSPQTTRRTRNVRPTSSPLRPAKRQRVSQVANIGLRNSTQDQHNSDNHTREHDENSLPADESEIENQDDSDLDELQSEGSFIDETHDDQQTHLDSNRLPLANSTNVRANSRRDVHTNYGDSNDPGILAINRLANILNDTISSFQTQSMNNSLSSREILRRLPDFSGSPSDWLHSKQSVNLIVESNQCDDREVVLKLSDSLRGEARSSVRSLFTSGSSATEIMETLELRSVSNIEEVNPRLLSIQAVCDFGDAAGFYVPGISFLFIQLIQGTSETDAKIYIF
ncbi:hypothetical protein QAD02_012619 [Eretmocerus hayati]|uniref:Uncharacterized protein n=1 Tax=Eretmocerus hayati TaxID=131215 RepID=A0ACC2P0C1_9HYME|nr:hypothetical protein QAD02_012619 [Eretmocerus hayati]